MPGNVQGNVQGNIPGKTPGNLRNTATTQVVDRMLRDVYENLDPLYRRIADALILHGMLEIVDDDSHDVHDTHDTRDAHDTPGRSAKKRASGSGKRAPSSY